MSGRISLSSNMRAELGVVSDWAKLDAESHELLRDLMRLDPEARAAVRSIANSFIPRPEDELLKTTRMGAAEARWAVESREENAVPRSRRHTL